MTHHKEGTLQGVGGLNLYYQSWHPEGQVCAVLAIVHGLGGHSGLFGNVVQYFVPKNYAIYGFDLRGHGRSQGQRGHINHWSEFREDARTFLQLIKTQEPGCPCFLLGHSVGAVIVFDYVLRSPAEASALQGVVALSPALGPVGVPAFKLALGRLLSRVWPHFTLNTGIDLSAASSDPAVLAAYAQDQLRHSRGSARLSTQYLDTVAWIQAHAADWRSPLLILHGGADQVALPEGGYLFFQRVTILDKERREYPGVYHEIQNDRNYQEMLTDLDNWLERHLPPQSA
ncbi:MAG TPA: lysophospholipase [Waterburya sp.]|jgi:alpha-beta hydrolase superfamily lysophospholipase